MIKLEKYELKSSTLRRFAQFIWHMTNDEPVAKGKLLPVINTDLIINVSSPIIYLSADGARIHAPPVHIRNIRLRPQLVEQAAGCDVWGVSLLPYGVFPFVSNTNGYSESVIDLCGAHPSTCVELLEGLRGLPSTLDCPAFIEEDIKRLVISVIPDGDLAIMDDYFAGMLCCGVGEYCELTGVGVKRLERILKKYTGLTPKQLQRIARFQRAGNELIYSDKPSPLASVTYAHEYADQNHFTKTFREYAGETPFLFMNSSDIIKERIFRRR